MALKNMFSQELLDEYAKGRREFDGIHLRFGELMEKDLRGLVIKGSELEFVRFTYSNLENARFENCRVFIGGFSHANMKSVVIDNCDLDYCYFEKSVFRNTKITNSNINWSAFPGTNLGELDTSTSTKFRFITDVSQLTQSELDSVMRELGPWMKSLDIEIRQRLEQLAKQTVRKHGLDYGQDEAGTGKYEKRSGYQHLNKALDDVVRDYGQKAGYGMASSYRSERSYASKRKKDPRER